MKFDYFHQIACQRAGGEAQLASRLPQLSSDQALIATGDDRYLAAISKCVFRAGFVWRIIEHKWPDFEAAFSDFVPVYWQQVPPERLEQLARDERIVRNMQKIATVPRNAQMIVEASEQHGGFGHFLAQWPHHDQVGLLAWLKKYGSRLGGMSAQHFLRMVGWDGFVVSNDVITALQNHRLIDANPTSQKGMRQVQTQFNRWHEETEMPYAHLSRILSMTVDAT